MIQTIHLIKQHIDKNNNYYGSFIIEPLNLNEGITIGNTLRRVLLNDLSSFCITEFRINNLKHQFSHVEGLKEDFLEFSLNLKEIIFKSSSFYTNNKSKKITAILNVKGPIILTAGMFKFPKNILKIINPNHYLGTLTNNSNFILESTIENNTGYLSMDDIKIQQNDFNNFKIDANFNPIKIVNYKIHLINDIKGNLKESLFIEITTNGSITPKRSLKEAIKLILNLFYPLLLNNTKQFLIK